MKHHLSCLLLLLLVACASPQSQPRAPVTTQATLSEDKFTTSDGTELPYRRWLPEGNTKAIVIALHGFNDYSHGFQIPAEFMRLHGIATYAFDERGFGSAPGTGIWAGEENLTLDAADMVNALRQRYTDTPIYILGESMGGAVAIAAATRPDFPHIDGVILVAPAIWGGDTMNPFFRLSLWVGAHTFPAKKLTGEDLHILASDNIDMLRAFGKDPLVIKATRIDSISGLVHIMDAGYQKVDKVTIPMLLLYGSHDQVIPRAPIVKAVKRMQPGSKIAYYPLGYHMLLRDLHGDVPVHDILAWIENHAVPLPSGHDESARKYLN